MRYSFDHYEKSPVKTHHLKLGGSNPQGETIDVTSLYLTRGGKPWLPVMGEFHFSRYDADKWEEELSKMKAGGVTVVASYLFWIYHEEQEDRYDFTGDLDIRRFVSCCKKLGLDVVIRIGPWAHGECRNGGFPDWLLKKGIPLRQNDGEYLKHVEKWFRAIYHQVCGLFYKDGGNIIGVQIENELVDGSQHLLALKQMAVEIGLCAPLYTVTGWNSASGARIPVDEVLPVFAAYPDAPWASGIQPLPLSSHYVFNTMRNDSAVGADIMQTTAPDGWRLPYELYPYATCEIGPGQQSTYHRRVRISGMDAYALSLVKLGSGNNLVGYYMYHGGTNKIGKLSTLQESRATGYPNDYPILNYDFDTALTQYGEAQEQYGLLNLLHMFAGDFGALLAPMETVSSTDSVKSEDFSSLRYSMRTDGKSGFVFINHYQRHGLLEPISNVVLDTGSCVFPSFNVTGEVAFFFPFEMKLMDKTLHWATALPICKMGNATFFAAVPGIAPQYQIEDTLLSAADYSVSILQHDGVNIVTLPWEKAVYLRKLGSRLVYGENCNLYEQDGQILSIEPGSFTYYQWENHRFIKYTVQKEYYPASLTAEPCHQPFEPPYIEELCLGGSSQLCWQRLTVSTSQGMVELAGPYDVAQIYADRRLVADNFYCGEPWRVPAAMLFHKDCYLVTTPFTTDVYLES